MDQAIKITSELIKRRSVTPNDDGTIEFLKNLDKWANKNLFEKKNRWEPKFRIE